MCAPWSHGGTERQRPGPKRASRAAGPGSTETCPGTGKCGARGLLKASRHFRAPAPRGERAWVTLRGLLRRPQPGPGPSSSLPGRETPAGSQGRPHPGLPRRRAPLARLRRPPLLPVPLRAPKPSRPAPGALAAGSGCHPPCPSGAPVSARKGRLVHTRGRRKPKALPWSSGRSAEARAPFPRLRGRSCRQPLSAPFALPLRVCGAHGAAARRWEPSRDDTRWAAGSTLSARPAGR